MLRTFNCGVGFCLIVQKEKFEQNKNSFKDFMLLMR